MGHIRRAANVSEIRYRLTVGEAMSHLDYRSLRIAEEQEVGAAVEQDRAPDAVAPVVVVRNPPKTRLNAADHDRHVFKGLSQPLAVHRDGTVRPLARRVPRCIGIVIATLFISRVVIDHRVHVAGGHAKEQIRAPKGFEWFRRLPIGLGDHPDTEALCL